MLDNFENEFETENDRTPEPEPQSPIGRLMMDDDEDEETADAPRVHDRFSRLGAMAQESRPVAAPPPAEPPPRQDTSRRPKPERPRDEDIDFFEKGMQDAQATRPRDRAERRKNSTPSPRPTMRTPSHTQRRMTAPAPRPRDDGESGEYNGFRNRYKPDGELISTTRGDTARRGDPPQRGDTGRRPKRPPQPDIDLGASTGFSPPRSKQPPQARRYEDSGDGTVNTVRLIIAVVFGLLLLVAVIALFSRASARRDLAAAEERIESMEETYGRANQLQAQNDSLHAENDRLLDELATLRAAQAGTTATPGDVGTGDSPYTTPTEPLFELPVQHVILPGQNLTAIAILYYGRGTDSQNFLNAQHIASYNNINVNNPIAGAEITIPPLP